MTAITKFKAIDGKEFDTEKECIDYEKLIDRVNQIMSLIPKRIEDTDFANGSGFIQHNEKDLKTVKVNFLNLCKEYIDHKWIQQAIDDDTVHPSCVQRLLGDYNIMPLYKEWNRFSCIDSQFREWGQPYFATHPEEAKQVCLS